MPTLRISTTSRQYVPVPVRNLLDPAADPTVGTVEMAFMPSAVAKPVSGDWKPASWLALPAPDPSTQARRIVLCLIGPGGGEITLAAGAWWPWVRFSDAPEAPEIQAAAPFVVY